MDVLYDWTVTSTTILKRQALSSLMVLTVITLILMKLLHRVLIEDNNKVQKVGNVIINEDIMFIMSSPLVHNQNDNVAGSIGGVSEVVKDKKEVQYGSIHITDFDL